MTYGSILAPAFMFGSLVPLKVGVVGRTGSGKSTLMLSLLQLTEITEGRISVDGFDLGMLPLASSRSIMSWIPQSPVMFAGTLRFNLDPFDEV